MRKLVTLYLLAVVVAGCSAPKSGNTPPSAVRSQPATRPVRRDPWQGQWDRERAAERQHRDEQAKRVAQEDAADKQSIALQPGESYDHFMERGHLRNIGIPPMGKTKDSAHDRLEVNGWYLQSTHTDGDTTIEIWNGRGGSRNEYVTVTYRNGVVAHVTTSRY